MATDVLYICKLILLKAQKGRMRTWTQELQLIHSCRNLIEKEWEMEGSMTGSQMSKLGNVKDTKKMANQDL